jgi:hypothetical protein
MEGRCVAATHDATRSVRGRSEEQMVGFHDRKDMRQRSGDALDNRRANGTCQVVSLRARSRSRRKGDQDSRSRWSKQGRNGDLPPQKCDGKHARWYKQCTASTRDELTAWL